MSKMSQTFTTPKNQAQPKYMSDGDSKKEGGYNKSIYETLKFSYHPYLYRIISCLLLGIMGRGLLLSQYKYHWLLGGQLVQSTRTVSYTVQTFATFPARLFNRSNLFCCCCAWPWVDSSAL